MIESIQFKNFQVLREAILPLGRFTLIVGPNGSGKSTVMKALHIAQAPSQGGLFLFPALVSAGVKEALVEVVIHGQGKLQGLVAYYRWAPHGQFIPQYSRTEGALDTNSLGNFLTGLRIFSFEANAIAAAVTLTPNAELQSNGTQLPAVLDRLRDQHPERFEALNAELSRWLPEFDRILFDTPVQGHRSVVLRTRDGGHKIPAHDLSQGTLIVLAVLTLAYLPNPPTLVGLEEPDRGLHPRLLGDVRDAIYRLAYPENCGEKREPVQVVATTHSPYFLDLFRDHPDEIVIAEKVGMEARFQRLSDRSDLHEILGDAHLGDVWYSGVLGGVPTGR